MATNNYFGYSGTQYAAANAAYQQTQQAYGVPAAGTGATSAASYNSQRSAYDAAYQTSATPVTYSAPAAVGVTYDSTKTYYQQAAPNAAAVAASTGQGAVTVGSNPEFQTWQQANYQARQSNAVAVAAVAAANKVGFCTSYTPVAPTRQLTVPPIPSKIQTTNASPYGATQFGNQQPPSATNYNYSNPSGGQNVAKAASVGTIGQPPKKNMNQYQQKSSSGSLGIPSAPNVSAANNANVAGYNVGNSVNVPSQNNTLAASAYPSIGNAYSNPNVGNTMYNANNNMRPKTNQGMAANSSTGNAPAYSNPYDAALYNAAATMYMNQNPRAASKGGSNYKPRPGLGSNPKFKNFRPPKPQQLHYCDACKISCAGPSAYHDHLQGQKHKKKVAKAKPEQVKKGTPGGNLPVFICELCDIECTAADAYAAHLRGAKHKKVVKLHTKLGKPIPPPDPKAAAAIAALSVQEEAAKAKENNVAVPPTVVAAATSAPKSVTPRITFVAAGNSVTAATSTALVNPNESLEETSEDDKKDNDLSLIDDRPAVGSEYIEEEKDASGKLISFNCKLCECKFSDPNAKEMHMKGRKHRLQFKKKVDPKLKVEMKSNNFKHKRNEKWKKQADKQKEIIKRKDIRYDDEMKDYFDWCRKSGGVPAPSGLMHQGIRHPMLRVSPRPLMMGPGGRMSAPPQSVQPMFLMGGPPLQPFSRKLETFEDRHVLTRHKAIYPTDVEVKNIQKIVEHIEKALKLVSDHMLAEDEKKLKEEVGDGDVKEAVESASENVGESKTNAEDEQNDSTLDDSKNEKDEPRGAVRELTGVLRIGIIAKGLLLTGDAEIDLVMLCSGKPTMSLLNKVVSFLPDQLKDVSKDFEYVITPKPADAALVITTCPKEENEKTLTVKVTLTSTVIREEIMAISDNKAVKEEGATDEVPPAAAAAAAGDGCKVSKEISPDPPDVLSKTKCLEALAALRHAKWFQARAATVQSCLIVIRILRDLCRRVPTWAHFNSWALELLCEKVFSSSNMMLSPGDGLRRVFESISSGILLPDAPGLLDPCEKDPVDATACLTPQEREDITAFAQGALRLIAFRQIHKVLGMEPLPPVPKFRNKQTNRKRRRENSAGGKNEGIDGKKDKKDAEEEPDEEHEAEDEEDDEEEEEAEKMDTDVKSTIE